MSGPAINASAMVACAHGAPSVPTTEPTVMVEGAPAVVAGTPLIVSTCPMTFAALSNPQTGSSYVYQLGAGAGCTVIQLGGSSTVLAGGLPLAYAGAAATCSPSGVPPLVAPPAATIQVGA